MDATDLKILHYLADRIEIVNEPYRVLGDTLGLDEAEVLERIKKLQESGVLKRISPILFHHKTTFQYNALTAWQVPASLVQELAEQLMAYTHVSHVYERQTCPEWPYNVFGMMHGKSEDQIHAMVDEIKGKLTGVPCKVIYTTREWKKTSPNLKYLLKE